MVSEQSRTAEELGQMHGCLVDKWSREDEDPVTVNFSTTVDLPQVEDHLVCSAAEVVRGYEDRKRTTQNTTEFEIDQVVMGGIARLLHAAGLLDDMTHAKQQHLLADLAKLIFSYRSST